MGKTKKGSFVITIHPDDTIAVTSNATQLTHLQLVFDLMIKQLNYIKERTPPDDNAVA